MVGTRKREHSRKALPSEVEGPDEFYYLIKACSPGPRPELFARGERKGWTGWGNQAEDYEIGWETYAHNSRREGKRMWAEAAGSSLMLELDETQEL